MFYLLNLLHFIHAHVDSPDPQVVLLAQIDLSKEFLNVSHQDVVNDLYDMKVSGWILWIFVSYLSK